MRRKIISTRQIAFYALLTALTTAATFAVKIPTPATEGYVNAGDVIVFFTAAVFGPVAGFLAGGLGSCLADLAGGYAHWVVPTLIIKGVEGALAGGLLLLYKRLRIDRHLAFWLAVVPSSLVMIAGYFAASAIMKGSVAVALISVPSNCLQALVGAVAAYALLLVTGKIKGLATLAGGSLFHSMKTHKTVVTATKQTAIEPQTEKETEDAGDAGMLAEEVKKADAERGGESSDTDADGDY